MRVCLVSAILIFRAVGLNKVVSVQMDAERKQQRDRSTNTREQRAKIAGVSAGTVAYDTKEEVMERMLDIQLGRRNLSPIQRIAVTEKYRPIYL